MRTNTKKKSKKEGGREGSRKLRKTLLIAEISRRRCHFSIFHCKNIALQEKSVSYKKCKICKPLQGSKDKMRPDRQRILWVVD
jgi:hypothetical protein